MVSGMIGLLALKKMFLRGAVKWCRDAGVVRSDVEQPDLCKGGEISMDFGSRQVWL